jgi:hypothetical protein
MEQTRSSDNAIVTPGWFFVTSTAARPGISLMKPIHTASSFGLDHLATWNERMRAISVSSKGVLALDGDFLEMDSAFKGRACNLLEDDMWLAVVRETPGAKNN